MKKLIISIVATASIALVAKADVAPNATSFETYLDNVAFDVGLNDNGGEGGYIFWSGGGTEGNEGVFEIKALGGEGGLGVKPEDVARPKYWDSTTPDAKALSIDTDVALSRHVNADRIAQDIGTGLYFDSMVQFTATDMAPTVTPGDKLIVWLKEIPSEEEGGQSTYKLCVTAAELDDDFLPKADPMIFETSKTIEPNSWHRLSIAANVETAEGRPNLTVFRVYLDSNEIVADKPFYSLVPYTTEYTEGVGLYNRISSVSFQGKGAIDDLVWTTEDPFVAPTKSYTVIVDDSVGSLIGTAQYQIGEADEVSVSLYDGETDETADFALTVPVDATSVTFFLAPGDDYEVDGGTFDNNRWVVTVTLPEAGSQITLKIIEKQVEEPVVKPFTVKIAGVDTPFETLAEAIAAAGGEPIKLIQAATLTKKLTVAEAAVIDLNGQTLTLANVEDNYAVVIKAALTITDSTNDKAGKVIVPGLYGFGMTAGSLTIDAGNFDASGADYLIGAWAGSVAISGGDFTAEYCVINLFAADASAEISGGKFTVAEESDGYPCYAILSEAGGKVAVSAGLFSTIVDEAFCAEGKVPTTEADDDGYYTVVDKADEKPTAGENELEAGDFEKPEIVNSTTEVTLPDGWTVSEDKTQILKEDGQPFVTFPSYYTATVVDGVIKLALNDTVKPVIAESKEGETTVKPMEFAKEGEADVVKLNVPVRNGNLFYGVKAAGTLTGLDGATPAWATTRGVNPPAVTKSGNAQFFRVVVTDVLPAQN